MLKPGTFSWPGVFYLLLYFSLCITVPASGFSPPPSEDVPKTLTIKGKEIPLKSLTNPLKNNPKAIKQGGILYTKHCFFCHGDLLDGKGIFGKSFFFQLPQISPASTQSFPGPRPTLSGAL